MTFKKLQICEIQARAQNNWECCFKCTINANGLHLSVRLWRVTDFFFNVQLYAVSKIYILSPRDKCRLKVEIAFKSILFFLNTWKWGLQRWYRVKTDVIANNNKRKRRIIYDSKSSQIGRSEGILLRWVWNDQWISSIYVYIGQRVGRKKMGLFPWEGNSRSKGKRKESKRPYVLNKWSNIVE